jgi:hypothetical protein
MSKVGRYIFRGCLSVFGFFFVMFFIAGFGAVWVMEIPILLATGWIPFLIRVVPEVTPNIPAILETVLVAAALGVGAHLFLRWLSPRLRAQQAEAGPWPVRWSVSAVALFVLLFLASMSTIGIGHHVGWLASSKDPLVESSWGFRTSQWGSAELCDHALRLARGGIADAEITRMLLVQHEMRERAEQSHVVIQRNEGSKETVLVFARDPAVREENGVVRCGGALPLEVRETVPAASLPRLLAGEQVAGEKFSY